MCLVSSQSQLANAINSSLPDLIALFWPPSQWKSHRIIKQRPIELLPHTQLKPPRKAAATAHFSAHTKGQAGRDWATREKKGSLRKMHLQGITAGMLLMFLTSVSAQDPTPACYRAPGLGSLSRAHRLEGLKLEILQRLGLEQEPTNPPNATNASFLAEYTLVKNSLSKSDINKRPPCANLDFHTARVLPYRPVEVRRKKRLTKIPANAECPSEWFNND